MICAFAAMAVVTQWRNLLFDVTSGSRDDAQPLQCPVECLGIEHSIVMILIYGCSPLNPSTNNRLGHISQGDNH
jgi:hypothetical protein